MLFNKNKNKSLPGYRFQNPKFKSRLKSAREYKRTDRQLPQNFWQKIKFTLKLDSWRIRIFFVAAILFLVYLGYFNNPFTIKDIVITGLKGEQAKSAKATALDYINKNKVWAQKSLVFFSKDKASSYIIAQDQNVLKVNSIQKDFPDILKLDLAPRFEQFEAEEPDGKTLILYNDGIISRQLYATTSLNSGMIKLSLGEPSGFLEGDRYLDADKISVLQTLAMELNGVSGYEPEKFKLPDFSSPDITLTTKNGGPEIYFDFYSDLGETLKNFRLLMSQVGEQDKYRLKYIDMRFSKKSFLCFQDAECAQEPLPEDASTTEETLLENIDNN